MATPVHRQGDMCVYFIATSFANGDYEGFHLWFILHWLHSPRQMWSFIKPHRQMIKLILFSPNHSSARSVVKISGTQGLLETALYFCKRIVYQGGCLPESELDPGSMHSCFFIGAFLRGVESKIHTIQFTLKWWAKKKKMNQIQLEFI